MAFLSCKIIFYYLPGCKSYFWYYFDSLNDLQIQMYFDSGKFSSTIWQLVETVEFVNNKDFDEDKINILFIIKFYPSNIFRIILFNEIIFLENLA